MPPFPAEQEAADDGKCLYEEHGRQAVVEVICGDENVTSVAMGGDEEETKRQL